MKSTRFWPQTAASLRLLPTAETWDHIPEFRKIPSQKRSRMGLQIDLYSDLEVELQSDPSFNLGEQIFMISWDRAIDNLPDRGRVSKSFVMNSFRHYLMWELIRIAVERLVKDGTSLPHSEREKEASHG